jgi:hypothetical protein
MGCLDIYDTSCVNYNGLPLNCFGVDTDTNLNSLLSSAHSKVCELLLAKGAVKVDDGDGFPKSLVDKLEAGANIILTGTGSGSTKKLRIDAILGGVQVDEKVKVSPSDSSAGFLENKIIAGDCITIQKTGAGLDEKLKIVIDWNCALGKISTLAGFCETVRSCGGGDNNQTQVCPSISLNSPAISGDDVTLSWVSTATQYNVYVDGTLLPGMPVSGSNYTVNNLINGLHTIQVSALCVNGSANSATTNIVINTTCPSASGLNVLINTGTASLTWVPASNANILNQVVQYKLRSASTWTDSATVATGTNSHTINGLTANRIYDFRIMTNCSVGGPTPSSVKSEVQTTCPSVTLTPTATSVNYSFSNVGGDVNQYIVELLNNTGTSVLQTKVENTPFATTITNSFSGLTQGTNYQVRVTVVTQEFKRGCSPQAISTSVPVSCATPSGLNATIN